MKPATTPRIIPPTALPLEEEGVYAVGEVDGMGDAYRHVLSLVYIRDLVDKYSHSKATSSR
jgi:hypothetical protein